MSDFFLKVVNMSISASWLVLAVLLLRVILKNAPKWVRVLLWGIVAVRLICPVSIESVLSLIPSPETISPEIMMDPAPQLHTGIDSLNNVINPIVSESFSPAPGASMNPLQFWIPLAAITWLVGVAALLIYTAVSYIRLRRKVDTAVLLKKNIYESDGVASPFVLGIVKPKIYLPFQMDAQTLDHVIAHEESHIYRRDHWWKPLGFLLLVFHWFNPLMWLSYILLCRDIELACDEKVILQMDNEKRADYTRALVACSVGHPGIGICPIAFGEVGVKDRVKSVMLYKKPAFWTVILAVIACIVVAVCFLTDPLKKTEPAEKEPMATTPAENEKVLPGNYDFTHDGIPEKTVLVTYSDDVAQYTWYELQVQKADGTVLWKDEAHTVHYGYNSLFVCTLEGKDYLLQYNPTMYQGNCHYSYRLFALDTQGNVVPNRAGEIRFDINWGSSQHSKLNAAKIAEFMDTVNGLLANSKLLLNTDAALEGVNPENPQDMLWWLQDKDLYPGYVYDSSKTLRDNLLALQKAVND